FHERFDVGAQKLGRTTALGADEMKMPRMTVRRFVARAPLPEIDLTRNVRVDHPLECSVDGRTTDTRFVATHRVEQIVGADVARLPKENVEDAVSLARTF